MKTADTSEELSKENKQIAKKSLESFEKNLIYAGINNGEKNIILGTDNEDTFVAITDEIIEVVERIGEYDFLINGEEHHIEVTISDSSDDSETALTFNNETIESGEVGIMSSWKLQSTKWVNVNAQRNFHTYTASALGGIIGTILGGVIGGAFGSMVGSLAVGMAYNYAASSQYPTNVGRSHLYMYTRGKSPLVDRKTVSYDYAVYNGKNVYLGKAERIKRGCVGCGV
ncbi:hypothetical protein [Pseudogracilibacillus auburnensis]|uniref:hypothetical protein n=1 Tax=Pseudogracilibacillus auburnensis TaxID=1494959 RepID=UPI001A95958F|nr:hypothetical protein [Pseudogracilibacillus auburnensis]MBO1001628.1 hypothetical protein [Pseudogracilibacillus auburnensis]